MEKSFFILGRQPNLGMAELESYYDPEIIDLFLPNIAVVSQPANSYDLEKLGGSIKIADYLEKIPKSSWPEIEEFVLDKMIFPILDLVEGKIDFGISCYGLNVSAKQITGFSLSVKKAIKSHNRSIRIVPNVEPELSSAQVVHNKLTGPTGFELIIAANDSSVIFGKTVSVQNITNYSERDQNRPKRDAKVGMLPPKLAQIMINLAKPEAGSLILDPFCGTGVILQEALLMGHPVYGTDLNPKMVEFSTANLDWLSEKFYDLPLPAWKVEIGDATTHQWSENIGSVVSETYLGKPLLELPSDQELKQLSNEVSDLVEKFLTNLTSQIKSGTRICIAVPAWYLGTGYLHLSILDHLEKIGYNHMSFKLVDTNALIYHRPQQLVGRQLLVLIRK